MSPRATIASHPGPVRATRQPASRPTLPRPAVTPELLAGLAARLTARDRWLLAMLHEHRVLTTTQITQLAFGSQRAATGRLLTLYQLRAVDRFRPLTPVGSAPWHFVLDDAGAAVLAAERGITVAELGYRRDHALAIAHSARLAHTVGTNGFFTALAATARHTPGAELRVWWSERRCAHTWGDLARPDGYGRWREGDREVDFFLEYDTGTETLDRVAAKLPGYADLAHASGITTPVLFWLPTARREAALRHLLHRHLGERPAGEDLVPAATAARDTGPATDPAGPVWLPLGTPGPRLRLIDLATHLLPPPASQPAAPASPQSPLHAPAGPDPEQQGDQGW